MKKSHRKDVIIARVIFAVVLLLLIALIVGAVIMIRGHMAEKSAQESQGVIVTENSQEQQPVVDTQTSEPEITTEDTQAPNPVVQTTTGVNLRKEPNTECEVLTVLDQGTMLELIGEEDGWAVVDYQGQIGYVKIEYLQEVM
ncbi:MAG: SH3 domain-containing protein [Lachnospiraceae bacterium]|nr:SH3 domain-containing protein [Lachnospiraceae bacterium]MDY5520469.1 SH3 domain-containing protein [Agathobacter sp.]